MGEKNPAENKKFPPESLEGIDMGKLYSGIGRNVMGKSHAIGRVFLRKGGYTEEQIEQIESATPQIKQSPEDYQKTIDFYKKLAGELEKDKKEKLAKIYREAAEKLEKELEQNKVSE